VDLITSRAINISSLAMDGLSARHKAISSNIANAETPDYKRIDVSFEDQLGKIINTENVKELQKLQNSGQMPVSENKSNMPLSVNYNQGFMESSDFEPSPFQSEDNPPNTKGNTVNIETEMSELTKNGMTYNALATLQSKAFKGLGEVIRSQY
jgi:flagellar basal-body rod protein FlgB